MSTPIERRLMRLVHGELGADEGRELERRLERDGELRALYRRYAELWEDLELPPGAPVPEGFSAELVARARRQSSARPGWSPAPAWARAASAAALATGLAVGAWLGSGPAAPEPGGDPAVYDLSEPLSLAEAYWLTLEESEGLENEGAR